MKKLNNKFANKFGPWALITGASSGIGAEFAKRLAKNGLNVVLVARRKDRLTALAHKLEQEYSVETKVVSVDLAQDDFLIPLRDATADIEIGLLINSAGFATSGHLLDNDLDAELAMLHVNSRAPLILSHYFGKRSTAVVGWVNKIIVISTRFTPRWLNAVIFGRVVKLMQSGQSPQQSVSQVESTDLVNAA